MVKKQLFIAALVAVAAVSVQANPVTSSLRRVATRVANVLAPVKTKTVTQDINGASVVTEVANGRSYKRVIIGALVAATATAVYYYKDAIKNQYDSIVGNTKAVKKTVAAKVPGAPLAVQAEVQRPPATASLAVTAKPTK